MTDNFDHETLDPEDWDAMRALAHRMVDDSIDYLKSVGDRPVWTRVPEEIEASFSSGVPTQPSDPNEIYDEFLNTIFPYPMGNIHPRFWSWYMGNGTIMGALADFMAATMNPNMGGGSHSAAMVENQVTNWIKEVVGFPEESSGLLVSGGSMANLVGLTTARNVIADHDVRKEGIQNNSHPFTVYTSTEAHSSNQKAIELLGLGSQSLRKIPVNDDFTLNLEKLKEKINEDIQSGFKPICVIATSGTVNTGAIDDLNAVADICHEHHIWFHVDGAIGAIGMLSETIQPLLSGISRADSVALDLHKWMHIPFEAGCVLVRDQIAHRETFSLVPEYLEQASRGVSSGNYRFSEYGVQLSRSFRALKIWMSMKEHGTEKLGRMMTKNIKQAEYLGQQVKDHPDLELVAPIGLDIVCYRYNPRSLEGQKLKNETLNELNREIMVELQEQGIAAPSYTTLNGVYCLRTAIANHRSRLEDFDVLIKETIRIGEEVRIKLGNNLHKSGRGK